MSERGKGRFRGRKKGKRKINASLTSVREISSRAWVVFFFKKNKSTSAEIWNADKNICFAFGGLKMSYLTCIEVGAALIFYQF